MHQINWNPDSSELKKFGFWMIVLCLIAAVILYVNGLPIVSFCIAAFGLLSGVLSLLSLSAAKPFYRVWMSLSLLIGMIVAPIVFSLLYYAFISPYAFFMRLFGRDRLVLKKGGQASYWVDVQPVQDKKRYLRQF